MSEPMSEPMTEFQHNVPTLEGQSSANQDHDYYRSRQINGDDLFWSSKSDSGTYIQQRSEEPHPHQYEISVIHEQNGGPSPEAPIFFRDAIGRKFTFPYEAVREWQEMEKLIKQAFLHESMCPRVDSGRYELLSLRDEIILPQLWSAWVKPGAYITMHMCRTPKEEQHKTTEKYDDSDLESQSSTATSSTTLSFSSYCYHFSWIVFLWDLFACLAYGTLIIVPITLILLFSQLKWRMLIVGVSTLVFSLNMSLDILSRPRKLQYLSMYVVGMMVTVLAVQISDEYLAGPYNGSEVY